MKWSLAFSPGLAVVHTDKAPIFTARKKDRGKGLEAQSEDGIPDMLAKSLEGSKEITSVAGFTTPVGAGVADSITPGAVYEVTVSAMPGDRLTLTTMMGQSNNWFYVPANQASSCSGTAKPSAEISARKSLSGMSAPKWIRNLDRNGPGAAAKSTQHRQGRERGGSKD